MKWFDLLIHFLWALLGLAVIVGAVVVLLVLAHRYNWWGRLGNALSGITGTAWMIIAGVALGIGLIVRGALTGHWGYLFLFVGLVILIVGVFLGIGWLQNRQTYQQRHPHIQHWQAAPGAPANPAAQPQGAHGHQAAAAPAPQHSGGHGGHSNGSLLWTFVLGGLLLLFAMSFIWATLYSSVTADLGTKGAQALYPMYNGDPNAISVEGEAKTENCHTYKVGMKYFDVKLESTDGKKTGKFGREGHICFPNDWQEWRNYWVSDEKDKHVAFLFDLDATPIEFGHGVPFGTALPAPNDYRFLYKPRTFRLQGKGTIRFERVQ